ncbi:ABC transporter substrate-binding protein [Helicobacter jaachi]|uniref:ABC transporter substrate-binding protein n=1 Tax=Helicobacter jaachi TaxID=1677920 RepID=A0A4U8TGA6_9HELI|nr:ABC transporter substrate-binding protein [Helicobacter jaachi]TLD97757.1 ABC transporter substrate-binding protein [Helicobacter jaachi]
MKKYIFACVFISLIFAGCGDKEQNTESSIESSAPDSIQQSQNAPDVTSGALPTLSAEERASCKRALGTVPPLTVLLELLYPEGMIGLNYQPYPEDIPFMPEGVSELPVLGVLSKGTLSFEEIAKHKPDVVFFGEGTLESITEPYQKAGIEVVKVPAFSYKDLSSVVQSYADALSQNNGINNICGQKVAQKAELLLQTLKSNQDLLAQLNAQVQNRPSVYFAADMNGLKSVCLKESGDLDSVIPISLFGGTNALPCSMLSESGQFAYIDFELLAKINPQVIFVRELPLYKELKENPSANWANLDAIKNKRFYYAPSTPSNWLTLPPSVMQNIGFLWAFSKLHPDLLDDAQVKSIAKAFFATFLRELSDEDYASLQGL